MDRLQNTQIPILQQTQKYLIEEAIVDAQGVHTYQMLIEKAIIVAEQLLLQTNETSYQNTCIAHIALGQATYPIMQWGIWIAGAIAVPINVAYPLPELEYILTNADAKVLLITEEYAELLTPLATQHEIKLLILEQLLENENTQKVQFPVVTLQQPALMIYTSGTTSKPKGVVTTHQIIAHQVSTLVQAWEWTSLDFALHTLPLHHVHGIINILYSGLWVGAKLEMLPKFEVEKVWQKFTENAYTVFMAVPTIYHRLIQHYEKAEPKQQRQYKRACQDFRLMVSGSAALPVSVLHKWQEISGHVLLERYGMTEIGMALSNPLNGNRKAGFVGKPLPNVEIKLLDEAGNEILEPNRAGEIYVKSPSVFMEYWQNPQATQESFKDGWFKTGDIAMKDEEEDFQILGRNSVDIIKTAGYKVSALEVEAVLVANENIAEAAVIGIADEDKGEVIAAALVLESKQVITLSELKAWCQEQLALQKIPQRYLILKDLPRNAMGKVIKPEIEKLF